MQTKLIILLTLFVIILLSLSTSMAQVPRSMNYQGRLTDDAGNPVPDDDYSIVFRIYDAAVGGSVRWVSDRMTVPVADGMFSVKLGPLSSYLFSSDSSNWLGITVESDPEIEPRTQIITAPYAFTAGDVNPQGSGSGLDADMVDGQDATDFADIAHSHPWAKVQSIFHFVTFKSGSSSPIAFAAILADGFVQSSSGNVSCTYDGTSERYEITITGESYHIYNYSTIVTVADNSAKFATSYSSGGNLVVYIWEL